MAETPRTDAARKWLDRRYPRGQGKARWSPDYDGDLAAVLAIEQEAALLSCPVEADLPDDLRRRVIWHAIDSDHEGPFEGCASDICRGERPVPGAAATPEADQKEGD